MLHIFSSNSSRSCGKYLMLKTTLSRAKYHFRRKVNDVVVDTMTFGSEKTVFVELVGPSAGYFVHDCKIY